MNGAGKMVKYESMSKVDKERLESYLESFKTNIEILERAIDKEHIPNIFATLSMLKAQSKEITDTTAKRLYQGWQDGKYY
jgi:hypothetical protein